MATFTSDSVSGNSAFKPFPGGTVGVRYAKYTVTAVKSSDLDTGTDLVYGVGDGSDTDRYIAASTAGQGGTADEMDADVAPVAYTADDTIDIIVEVDPAGDVATGTLEMWVYVS